MYLYMCSYVVHCAIRLYWMQDSRICSTLYQSLASDNGSFHLKIVAMYHNFFQAERGGGEEE